MQRVTTATDTAATSSRGGRAGRVRRRLLLATALSALALLLLFALSVTLGAVSLSPQQAWSGLTSGTDGFARTVVWDIRVPRLLDAMLVGAALGVSGTLLQVVTRNPLADPTILGITAAAGLATAIMLVVDPQVAQPLLSLAAVGGGLVGAGFIFVIAWQGAISPIRLTLAGVALAAFFGAAIVGLLSSSRTFLQLSLGFLAGGLYASGWSDLKSMLPYMVPGLAVAYLLAGRLNVLALGDEVASSLGVLTDRTRLLVLAIVGVLTGAAVAVAGLVSFVGLVAPHLARFVVGNDHRYLIPASALAGALLVGSADLAARLVIRPAEIPMGIITAAIGAPFLLYLLRFRRA